MSGRRDIAIACCRMSAGASPDELFPDPDSELLAGTLRDLGREVELVSWDDARVAWNDFGLVVVRSTWDSVDRPEEYLRWAGQVEESSTLVNPGEVLAWNLDKTYLRDLAAAGVPVVPTEFTGPGATWAVPDGEFVVKPSISAGGRETARYGPAHRSAAEAHVARLVSAGHQVMVQPYMPGVEEPGEVSLVFFDGTFSHAVRKGPVLEAGAGVVERPWERMVFLGSAQPSPAELAAAGQVQAFLADRFGPLAYSRIDLVPGSAGEPLVMEVELIDPYLSLSVDEHAPLRLAHALLARHPKQ